MGCLFYAKKVVINIADGNITIKITVDGKEVNIASNELKKLGEIGHNSSKGIEQTEKGMNKAGLSAKKLAVSLGLVKIASVAFNVLRKSLDSAISRFDTLNTFPKIMNSVGVSTQEAERAIDKINNGLEGTTGYLHDVTSNAQRMYFALGDLDKSADLALALQRAFDASAASTDQAKRGTEQFIQALQKGKFDMEEWKTLQETMGVGLNELAKEFGFTGASAQRDLYQALKDGHITMDEFTDKLIEIGSATGTLGEMAKTNASTLRNEMEFLANATSKGLANILESVNNLVKEVTGKDIARHIQSLRFIVDASFNAIGAVIEGTAPIIKVFAAGIKELIPIVETLTPQIIGLISAYAGYTVIAKMTSIIQASNAILKVAQASKTGLTLVTKAHTVALAADLKMEQAQAAKMIATTGAITLKQLAIGALTGKITLFTAAQTIATAVSAKFSAIMAALSGPIGWATLGIGALVTSTIAVIKSFKQTSEEAEKLNSETEELGETTNSLKESLKSSSSAYEENQAQIKASADANSELVNKIEELAEKEDKSATEKQLLNSYIEELNGSVEGLNLSYNEEANALNLSSEEMAARIDLMKEQETAQVAQERLTEILKEQSKVEQQLSETKFKYILC